MEAGEDEEGPPERIPTIVVGDIHADFDAYQALLRREEARAGRRLPSIQMGDYGIGRGSDSEAREVRRFHLANRRHHFIRGNHDAPEEVVSAPGYIPDGTISGRVLFLGGADNPRRGVRAWEDTEMAEEDMAEVLARLQVLPVRPDVVVSHDAPQAIVERLWTRGASSPGGTPQPRPSEDGLRPSRTRLLLDEVHAVLRPVLWLFGHWHEPWAYQDGPTHFRCVGYHEAFTVSLPWEPSKLRPATSKS